MSSTPCDQEFDDLVPDEAAAEAIFLRARWPNGVCCPHCGSTDMTRLATRPVWQCRPCRAQTSLRSGTVLHRTSKPLRAWVYAAWKCASRTGASTRSMARHLGYRYETLWVMVHKVRAALAERGIWQLKGPAMLGAAEIAAPKRANGEPPGRPPVLVALAAQEEPVAPQGDALRIEVAEEPRPKDPELLRRARERHVEHGAEPRVERERVDGLLSRGPRVLRATHRCLRLWLRFCFRGVSRRYMANYLAQFTYRHNRLHAEGRIFEWVVRRMALEPWRPRSDMSLSAP